MIVTGTGTGVGKTVVTAAVAALAHAAGRRVAVVKPAQTGVAPDEPGDLAEVVRLAGPVATLELARYPDPLAPATAARRAGRAPITADEVVAAVRALDADLVLVEGAGGLLVRFDDGADTRPPQTLADVAAGLDAPVLLVASAGLGVLNTAALTAEALRSRGLELLGVVVGAFPDRRRPRRADQPRRPPRGDGRTVARRAARGTGASAPGGVPRRRPVWPRSPPGWSVVRAGPW